MQDEYYKPTQITFTRKQILWLLRNVLFYEAWPLDSTDNNGSNSSQLANFVMLTEVIGELNSRMKLCGKAGLFLEYLTVIEYEDKAYLIRRLAEYHRLPDAEVSYQANLALRFCCGNKRKRVTFDTFCIYTKSRDRAKHKKGGR